MIRKRLVKKVTALAITGALTVVMAATVLAAPGGPGGNGGSGGGPRGGGSSQEMQQGPGGDGDNFNYGGGTSGGETSTGERPEMPNREAPTGERPEMPSGEELTGERPEMPSGEEFTGERPERSDGESAEWVQSEKPGRKGEREGGKDGQMKGGKGMKSINTDEIESAIDALEDEETKANLETLLNNYEAAKSALDEFMKEGSDDFDTYMEAERSAMEALRTALDEAGIDTRPELPKGGEKDGGEGNWIMSFS